MRYDDPDLAPISIVLTTLAGNFYLGEEHPLEALAGVRPQRREVAKGEDRLMAQPSQLAGDGEQAAHVPTTADWSPAADPPVNDAAPWAQVGWGEL